MKIYTHTQLPSHFVGETPSGEFRLLAVRGDCWKDIGPYKGRMESLRDDCQGWLQDAVDRGIVPIR